jgi:hypothetical protein
VGKSDRSSRLLLITPSSLGLLFAPCLFPSRSRPFSIMSGLKVDSFKRDGERVYAVQR